MILFIATEVFNMPTFGIGYEGNSKEHCEYSSVNTLMEYGDLEVLNSKE